MKITTNEAVYVQKNDLGYLFSSNISIPSSIYLRPEMTETMVIDDSNRYEFIKFEDQSEIEFFNGIKWMVEYNDVKDLSVGDILGLEEDTVEEQNRIARKYNAMSVADRKKNYHMVEESNLLNFKLYSLDDIVSFKLGKKSMELPEGIDYPRDYKTRMKIKSIFRKNIKR